MKPKALVQKPAVKVKALFWTKLPHSEVTEGVSVWREVQQEYSLPTEHCHLLDEWFAANPTASSSVGASSGSSNSGGKTAPSTAATADDKKEKKLTSVLDGKRTQNLLILLGKLRRAPEEVLQLVISLDATQLDAELTRTLIEVLPTAEGNPLSFCVIVNDVMTKGRCVAVQNWLR